MTVSDGGVGFDIASSVRDIPADARQAGPRTVDRPQVTDHVSVETAPNFTCVRVELTHEPQIGA